MIIARNKNELKVALKDLRKKNNSISFVPTLGGLHEGHLSLFKLALKQDAALVSSIFLNPLQFESKEDLETYPAKLEDDLKLAEKKGVQLLFLPSAEEIYPAHNIEQSHSQTIVKSSSLAAGLCGKTRAGHFDGVITVVNILFNLIKPDSAVFGEKDFQQLRLIEKMVEDLHLDTEIIRAPLVRKVSGLAISSRNKKLSKGASKEAQSICKCLFQLKELFSEEVKNQANFELMPLVKSAREKLSPELTLEYLEIREEKYLEEVLSFEINSKQEVRAFIAAKIEGVRLIDNIKVTK